MQRLSHNLQLYHRLDSDFILASEFDNLTRSNSTLGDAVYIGSAHDDFVVRLLSQNLTPARISENTGHLMINGQLATAFDRGQYLDRGINFQQFILLYSNIVPSSTSIRCKEDLVLHARR